MSNARTRRLARERALQFLFGLDFTGYAFEEEVEAFWESNPARPQARRYGDQLISGICAERADLDTRITAALEHWSPDRVGRIEWNIVRIALYEMLHIKDVPPNVAINEAIELAKRFGGDEAPRFVNGILDRLRKGVRC